MKTNFDINQLKDLMGGVTASIENLKQKQIELDNLQKVAKEQLFPKAQKNIQINGTDCIIQHFDEKITIVFPSKESSLKYFVNPFHKESTWFKIKNIFKK